MDCCGLGGTAGSEHERAQAAAGLRALIIGQARRKAKVESRAREQREQVTGLKWLTAGGSGRGCSTLKWLTAGGSGGSEGVE